MSATENLKRSEAQERASFLSTSTYDVTLDLTQGPTTFLTESTIRVTSTEERETFVDLIAPEVLEIELNGELLEDPASRFDGARVQLPALQKGENTIRIRANAAYMNTGEGLHRFVDPVDDEVYLYSQFEVSDARRMFACFEQPDLKAEFTFTVTAPAHWRVISIAPTPEPTDAGTDQNGQRIATWAFEATERISTYLTALIAGKYEGVEGTIRSRDGRELKAGVYARASLAEHLDGQNIIDVTQQGFDFYEEKFDCPYPFRKYDQVFVPEYNMGAMEHPGAVTYVEAYVFRSDVSDAIRERRDLTILHELAHMWFGDLVTMKWWDDLWLNESFAEYASTLASAEATKWTTAWTTFAGSEKAWAYNQDQLPSTHPIVADMVDFDAVETNFDGITYAKGASVLRQLVAYVGEDAFFEGLRAYFRKHAWGNTQLKDLLVELEATSGRDLTSWSALWLEKAGVTLLRPQIERDQDGAVVSFAVLQEAPSDYPTLRPHRLRIAGFTEQDGALVRTETVEVDVDGERTEIPELTGKQADLWLVNDGDLAYAKLRLDDESLATAMQKLSTLEDSLARTLIWSAAWDMVRDAELPSRRYQELLVNNIAGETESSVIRTLLTRLDAVAGHYAAPEQRAEREAAAGDALWRLTQQAEAGSDAQLQYLEGFLRNAVTDEQVELARALFDGSQQLPGRDIDTDLRWKIVIALAAAGALDDAQIDEVLASDDTQSGRKSALTAHAALPTEAAKAKAWEDTVEKDELANESVTSVVIGFNQGSKELLDPYTERFFGMLNTAWATRSSEIANRLVQGYFPAKFPSQKVVDLSTQWLEENADKPMGQRRPILEGRDTVQRALRVQRADAH
ncbi:MULTISPECIES: aminopeptidase N [Helcobacillus]|uniref:Aminopeptidase N n=1 Tax=Helcobacillus massiliensis TaxID=521392 RepID=A0A839QQH0_9MICO|nr:aminopeptidase N [Helcobacillus massiliensis]MBB3022743.1 aminopeptidase N [Helcobacillus massiliensis]MCG7426324.1 aminopeptidase N [Helcobacillus sp. ACRRO]MDK7742921.1 aminopeptidase N [Helcobacillus massiliensis]WOO92086.1 aminopeptidase N [Helcobacillus massiliensis]